MQSISDMTLSLSLSLWIYFYMLKNQLWLSIPLGRWYLSRAGKRNSQAFPKALSSGLAVSLKAWASTTNMAGCGCWLIPGEFDHWQRYWLILINKFFFKRIWEIKGFAQVSRRFPKFKKSPFNGTLFNSSTYALRGSFDFIGLGLLSLHGGYHHGKPDPILSTLVACSHLESRSLSTMWPHVTHVALVSLYLPVLTSGSTH